MSYSKYLSLFSLFGVIIFFQNCGNFSSTKSMSSYEIKNGNQQKSAPCADCFQFIVDRPIRVTGPHSVYPDNFVNLIPDRKGKGVLGFTGNEHNYRLVGPSADRVKIDPGYLNGNGEPISVLNRGPLNSFDSCGVWIKAIERIDSETILAWYHAEGGASEPGNLRGCNRKSIALAISYDNGYTFHKFNYNRGSQVITSPNKETEAAPGHGDHSVIRWGDYRYMFFWNASEGDVWSTSVARSGLWSWGAQGQWYKYLNRGYNSPGVQGRAEKLGGYGQSASVLSRDNYKKIVLLGINTKKGLTVSMGNKPEGPFTELREPLIPFNEYTWRPRTSSSPPLVAYPSANNLEGGNTWSNHFVLFYLYIEPGKGFRDRFLVRRHVWLADSRQSLKNQVKLRLSQYYNASQEDHWATTALAVGYQFRKNLGFLFTSGGKFGDVSIKGTDKNLLVDCYSHATSNHIIEIEKCSSPHWTLRKLGWIFKEKQPNSKPLYRCYDSEKTNHFLWWDRSCDNKSSQYNVLLGYIQQ